jgi:hypothetical protein
MVLSMNNGSKLARPKGVRKIDLRRVAEHHAAGPGLNKTPAETQRLVRLALNEAEALAAQTGVPELVLPALAEEKVLNLRRWVARQKEMRSRSVEWSLAA